MDLEKQELSKEVASNISEMLLKELSPIFEDKLVNFEDTLLNCVRTYTNGSREGSGALGDINIAYSEENDLNLYTTKEKMVDEFHSVVEETVEDVVSRKISQMVRDGRLT